MLLGLATSLGGSPKRSCCATICTLCSPHSVYLKPNYTVLPDFFFYIPWPILNLGHDLRVSTTAGKPRITEVYLRGTNWARIIT